MNTTHRGSALPWLIVVLFQLTPVVHATSGNPEKGKAEYVACSGCHSLAQNRTGPRHCGVLNRTAGSVDGFRFSKAMKNSGLIWDPPTLARFIESPLEVVPGTKMGFAGIKDKTRRENLVAYLIQASESKSACAKVGKNEK